MSALVLVDTACVPPHKLAERNLEFMGTPNGAVTTGPQTMNFHAPDSQWQMLSHMASQHHTSEYSRLKFGSRGASARYVPLCIHTPDVYHKLQLRQMSYKDNQVWWLSNRHGDHDSTPQAMPSASTLVHELSSAMEEHIPLVASCPSTQPFQNHVLKTSATHPINVSSIIPPDALALMSSHVLLASCRPECSCPNDSTLSRCTSNSTVCEISPSFTLDRFICADNGISTSWSRPDISPPPSPLRPRSPGSGTAAHLRTRSHVSQALQAAMNSGFPASPSVPSIGSLSLNVTDSEVYDKDNMTSTTIHANHSSVSLSLSVTVSTPKPEFVQKPPYCVDTPSTSLSIPELAFQDPLSVGEPAPNVIVPSDSLPNSSSSFTLGNLFLSSCPGKKVRLQGPVKGRSGVCRDLETDLRRLRDMGVGCIVCCLDDTELEFLGSPWPEYHRLAQEMGIDVMRLPTPEGLAPSQDPAVLNRHLTTLIQRYTLCGIPVLVHCRGGVGRAGVVACCWMIRLGLFGSLNDRTVNLARASKNNTLSGEYRALDVVGKAIEAVRRRRSSKAIETYEQVKFLLGYVDYLMASSI